MPEHLVPHRTRARPLASYTAPELHRTRPLSQSLKWPQRPLPSLDDAQLALHIVPAWESLPSNCEPRSPKSGRCAAHPAQRPALGEIGGFERRIRMILAQRPGLGEKRVRNIPAREKLREGPTHLPAQTSETVLVQKGDSLPRRDLAPKRVRFRRPQGRNSPKQGRCAENAAQRLGLGELLANPWDHLSQGGTMLNPNDVHQPSLGEPQRSGALTSPKPGRCARYAAHRLGLGEPGDSGKKARAALAQRPAPGEVQPRKIPARERTRAARMKRK